MDLISTTSGVFHNEQLSYLSSFPYSVAIDLRDRLNVYYKADPWVACTSNTMAWLAALFFQGTVWMVHPLSPEYTNVFWAKKSPGLESDGLLVKQRLKIESGKRWRQTNKQRLDTKVHLVADIATVALCDFPTETFSVFLFFSVCLFLPVSLSLALSLFLSLLHSLSLYRSLFSFSLV